MRRMDIEDVLRWAYRDELPKAQRRVPLAAALASSWASVAMVGVLGQRVDSGHAALNQFGLVPLDSSDADPHPDALAVHEAVLAADALELALPDDWNPLAGLGIGAEAAGFVAQALEEVSVVDSGGVRRPRERPSLLLPRRAILGAPELSADEPQASPVTWENGKARWFRRISIEARGAFGPAFETVEVDGYDQKHKRPYPNAYRKWRWDPHPVEIAVERAEWEIWVVAMQAVAESLTGRLTTIRVTGPRRCIEPWKKMQANA